MRGLLRALPLLALTACAEPPIVAPLRYGPSPPLPDDPARATAPESTAVLPSVPLDWQTSTLPNGLTLVVLERHALPIVAVQLVFARGSADMGASLDAYGILQRVLLHGTARRTADELSAAYARLGAPHGVFAFDDAWGIAVKAASPDLDEAVALAAENAAQPRLADLPSMAKAWAEDFYNTQSSPRLILIRNADAALYGAAHPYGFARPDRAHALALSKEDVGALHARLLHPAHATLVVTGDVTPAAVSASAARWLGGAPASAASPPRPLMPTPMGISAPLICVAERSETQVSAMVAALGPAPGDPDHAALLVLAQALGGLSSRLRGEVRTESGAAYNFGAHVSTVRASSMLTIQGALDPDKAIAALRSILAAIAEARSLGVREEDLDRAKTALMARWRSEIGTAEGLASLASGALIDGLPLSSVAGYPARIAAVTREDVRRVAARWLATPALRVITVGRQEALDGLGALGLGACERRDPWGAPRR